MSGFDKGEHDMDAKSKAEWERAIERNIDELNAKPAAGPQPKELTPTYSDWESFCEGEAARLEASVAKGTRR